jgi:hypothetical protein
MGPVAKEVRVTEIELQRRIQVAVSQYVAIFRIPSGMYYQGKIDTLPDGRPHLTGLRPTKVAVEGYPDLSGYRRSDGKAVFIEVKTATGRPSEKQLHFIEQAKQAGCIAGIARSVEEALELVRYED